MIPLLVALLACSGGRNPDTDTEDTEEPLDWGEVLFEGVYVDDTHLFVYTSSTTVGFQLAYDTYGAVSTWRTFEPPLELSQEDYGPLRREGAPLYGLSDVESRLVDGEDEELSLVFTFPEDEGRDMLRAPESEYGTDVLTGADLVGVEFEILGWLPSEDLPDALSVRWALWGTPG
jgi:hypothetical protein